MQTGKAPIELGQGQLYHEGKALPNADDGSQGQAIPAHREWLEVLPILKTGEPLAAPKLPGPGGTAVQAEVLLLVAITKLLGRNGAGW